MKLVDQDALKHALLHRARLTATALAWKDVSVTVGLYFPETYAFDVKTVAVNIEDCITK